MRQSNVEVVCTTDDPADDLAFHRQIRADRSFATKVLPTWRPDKSMAIENLAIVCQIKFSFHTVH